MKKIMEKSKYIQPEISICHVETDQMMMVGSPIPPRFDDPADGDIEVLTNMEKFKDIWGRVLRFPIRRGTELQDVSRFWGSP